MRDPDIARALVTGSLTKGHLRVIIVVHHHGEVITIGQVETSRGKIRVTWNVARDTHGRTEMLTPISAAAIKDIPLPRAPIHPTQAHISWVLADSQGGEGVFYAGGRIRDIFTGRIGLTMIGRA